MGVEDEKSNSVLTCTEAATVCSEGSVREGGTQMVGALLGSGRHRGT